MIRLHGQANRLPHLRYLAEGAERDLGGLTPGEFRGLPGARGGKVGAKQIVGDDAIHGG